MKKIRLIRTFYTSFFLSSIIITACCTEIFWKYGFSTFAALFWFKMATLGITFVFINDYKHKEYYYYRNLGVSKIFLWTATLLFDLALFLLLIFFTNKFR